jgi:hypothetical protein
MKRIITLMAVLPVFAATYAQGYKITLQTPSYRSGIAYLTFHMGKNLNVEDSTAISNKGTAVFTGKKELLPGIYAIVFPGKSKSLDFLVDKSQQVTISADTTDLLNKTVITGSKENVLFQQYQKAIAAKGKFLEKERIAFTESKTKADSALHESNYNKYNKELNDYREGIIKNEPGSMMAFLLLAMKDPQQMSKKPVTHSDSLENYYYYKAHYWDGITFMDERVIRTPFFLPKLERYYREVIVPAPDTIIKEADYHLLLARSCPEMYKFLLNWFTDEYFNPKYMGQDAILVHLYEKYHSKGVSTWLNEKQQEAIKRRAFMQMANLIGKQGANLEMLDTAGKPSPLYEVSADYTVLCFWDPTCGHCKEEVPRVDSIYKASWKQHNVKIYGVLTEEKKEDWIKFIREHNLTEWINVYQTKAMEEADIAAEKPSFRQLYDVTMTPTLYLLDKEKRIIGKKLSWQQLDEFLQAKWSGISKEEKTN